MSKVECKKSELPQFISKLCELCEEQEHEVERAVLQRGKGHPKPVLPHKLNVALFA